MREVAFDVIIIGGSYSGLSAALSLARFRRRVLIIDAALPANRQATQSHNFLGHDGEAREYILQAGVNQILRYDTVKIMCDEVLEVRKQEDDFTVTTKQNGAYVAGKLLLANGRKDILPPIDGFSSCWGISIIDCPYCHGYEMAERKAMIISKGKHAIKLSTLLATLHTDIVAVPLYIDIGFSPSHSTTLRKRNVVVYNESIKKIHQHDGHIVSVEFSNGDKVNVDIIYAVTTFELNGSIHLQLGCKLTKKGYISVDKKQRTSVPNVFASGDNSNFLRSISSAVYSGSKAGMSINKALANDRK